MSGRQNGPGGVEVSDVCMSFGSHVPRVCEPIFTLEMPLSLMESMMRTASPG